MGRPLKRRAVESEIRDVEGCDCTIFDQYELNVEHFIKKIVRFEKEIKSI